jgi:prophage DNA circulation protein
VEGLAMIPGLYTYAATAIVAGALAFGGGWKVQAWRYDAQIADMQASHAQASADAAQKAMDQTLKMQRTKDDAIKAAEQRAAKNAAAADSARRAADSLRSTLYSFRASLPGLTKPAAAVAADTAAELFGQCAGALTDVAAKADSHAGDALMLIEAWPKSEPR